MATMSEAEIENIEGLSYRDRSSIYTKYYSIGYVGNDIRIKFMLISLICHVVFKAKEKSPGITHYQIIKKLAEGTGWTDLEIEGLSIVCADFAYEVTEFDTYGLIGKDILKRIKDIMSNRMPF